MRRRALLLVPALAGCAAEGLGTPETARLPRDSIEGAGDPTSAAVSRAAYAFANPSMLAGRPGDAARAIADMEFMAASLPSDPRFQQRDPLLPVRLAQARTEWRQALGIPAELPAQPLVDRLYAVWRAMRAEDRAAAAAALPAGLIPPGGEAVLARLGALPPLPLTAQAANAAARIQFEGNLPVGRRRL
ncbi:hypothetical protein EJV46_07065 [Roseococcus sp. SYP-B2431]|uniref:hypothetical protein n=1 Tax=Roseococcus sp. SYP-B2431 TaxID=2496640 RepID=UPI0010EC94F8|nr:hypothetical protein [Roseococcus sp. SYP-B2431]TCI00386.1 hypothetical protein EJV46_07065 [Roseococcus sp. SYP-B2431]